MDDECTTNASTDTIRAYPRDLFMELKESKTHATNLPEHLFCEEYLNQDGKFSPDRYVEGLWKLEKVTQKKGPDALQNGSALAPQRRGFSSGCKEGPGLDSRQQRLLKAGSGSSSSLLSVRNKSQKAGSAAPNGKFGTLGPNRLTFNSTMRSTPPQRIQNGGISRRDDMKPEPMPEWMDDGPINHDDVMKLGGFEEDNQDELPLEKFEMEATPLMPVKAKVTEEAAVVLPDTDAEFAAQFGLFGIGEVQKPQPAASAAVPTASRMARFFANQPPKADLPTSSAKMAAPKEDLLPTVARLLSGGSKTMGPLMGPPGLMEGHHSVSGPVRADFLSDTHSSLTSTPSANMFAHSDLRHASSIDSGDINPEEEIESFKLKQLLSQMNGHSRGATMSPAFSQGSSRQPSLPDYVVPPMTVKPLGPAHPTIHSEHRYNQMDLPPVGPANVPCLNPDDPMSAALIAQYAAWNARVLSTSGLHPTGHPQSPSPFSSSGHMPQRGPTPTSQRAPKFNFDLVPTSVMAKKAREGGGIRDDGHSIHNPQHRDNYPMPPHHYRGSPQSSPSLGHSSRGALDCTPALAQLGTHIFPVPNPAVLEVDNMHLEAATRRGDPHTAAMIQSRIQAQMNAFAVLRQHVEQVQLITAHEQPYFDRMLASFAAQLKHLDVEYPHSRPASIGSDERRSSVGRHSVDSGPRADIYRAYGGLPTQVLHQQSMQPRRAVGSPVVRDAQPLMMPSPPQAQPQAESSSHSHVTHGQGAPLAILTKIPPTAKLWTVEELERQLADDK